MQNLIEAQDKNLQHSRISSYWVTHLIGLDNIVPFKISH